MKNKTINELVRLVRTKTPEVDEYFTKMMVLNKISQIVSNMRGKVVYMDGGEVPINYYGLMLATSGYAKGKTTNIIEDNLIHKFINRFMNHYAPSVAEKSIEVLAEEYSLSHGCDILKANSEIMKEWNRLPKHLYSFSDATIEGFKAKRVKLSMLNLGATNLEVDEIGLALERIYDILGLILEVYDLGKAKQKLIKVDSNSDSKQVPANAFFFGTPTRLLSGGKTEKIFIEFLQNGFARRSFFGMIEDDTNYKNIDSKEILKSMRRIDVKQEMEEMALYLEKFAKEEYHGKIITIDDEESIMILDYKFNCELRSRKMKKYQEIESIEMKHRYWKMFKLSGMLAFIDDRNNVSKEDVKDAIEFTEESGKAFKRIINRSPNHERLLDFIIDQERNITQADLVESLHFYRDANKIQKEEMLILAASIAYSKNAVIKRKYNNGVEFISAKKLENNDGSNTILSISTNITEGYDNKLGEFNNLKNIMKSEFNYCSHHFIDGYRDHEHAEKKMNIVVLDIDEGISLQLAMALMNDYKYIVGTTKRHQLEGYGDRFRMILQLDRTIELDTEEYIEFMQNIFAWLPFDVDTKAKDIARKWMGHPEAMLFENEGELLESINFIPDTSKAIETSRRITDLSNLDSLERFFQLNASRGNRNNLVHRFAMMLVSGGLSSKEIEEKVLKLNNSLEDKLVEKEIYGTIMKTVDKKINKRV